MQKWHIHAALRKGRTAPLRLHDILCRQFTVSSQEAQGSEANSSGRRRPSDTYYRSFKPSAVDARDLAAVPNPTPPPPRKSISDRIPAQRAPNDARTNVASRADRGPRIFSRRDPSDRGNQGGATNASHGRNRTRPNDSRNTRSTAGESRKRSAGGTRPGNGPGGERGKTVADVPSVEEIEYLKTRDTSGGYDDSMFEGSARHYTHESDSKTYTPADMSVDTLRGMGPALACGEWGMSETVGERMMKIGKKKDEYDERIEELARKWAEGEFCRFKSKQEKEDTIKTVERNLAGTGDNAGLDEEREKEKMALVNTRMKEEGEKLAGRLLKGDYYIGPLGKGPTAELLERYTRKNETYMPKDRQALAGKIGTLLPLKTPSAAANPART
ncbi:MAG: hypothetical protein LQ338_001932 [Usnochroma carphineum]|nr:MAG: hypothetical protein LQ338_001932 [Usnochroma carphineum]